jgi:hypothetical protein
VAMVPDELTAGEVYDLAEYFPVSSAKVLLSMARFPSWAIPESGYANSLEFWSRIAEQVAAGVMRDGRRQILAAAQARFPYSDKFAHPPAPSVRALDQDRPLRVLVIGASPSDLPPVRADQESRAISKASLPDRITVSYAPAAQGTDLEKVRSVRPHVVHFVCHGEDDCLLFNDIHGESDPVSAAQVASSLRFYRESVGIALRGVVLAACDGTTLAPAFAGAAGTVVGFHGMLSDPCGIAFAEQFYGRLNDLDDFAAAATEAAHLAAQFSAGCASLIAKLITLHEAT